MATTIMVAQVNATRNGRMIQKLAGDQYAEGEQLEGAPGKI